MGNTFETDILIVGAGPSGAATALCLKNHYQFKVAIIEQSDLSSNKIGEQVNISIFDLLEYVGISKIEFSNCYIENYSHSAMWGNDKTQVTNSIFNSDGGTVQLNRNKFDLLLMKKASEIGCIIFPRTKCIEFDQEKEGSWKVKLNHFHKGEFFIKAKYLIDASGRLRNVCRKIGASSIKHDQLIAIGSFFGRKANHSIRHESIIESCQNGWWYFAALPDDKIIISLFTDADIATKNKFQTKKVWLDLLNQTSLIKRNLVADTLISLWARNAFSHKSDSSVINNFIAVGDASVSFDPLSSMGIGFAISSACHAAKAINELDGGDKQAILNYQHNVDRIFNNYMNTKQQFYSCEKRWADSIFWQRRVN